MENNIIHESMFNLCYQLAPVNEGDIHIVNISDDSYSDQVYRVYHTKGYCIDLIRTDEIDEEGNILFYSYSLHQQWGEKIQPAELLETLKQMGNLLSNW